MIHGTYHMQHCSPGSEFYQQLHQPPLVLVSCPTTPPTRGRRRRNIAWKKMVSYCTIQQKKTLRHKRHQPQNRWIFSQTSTLILVQARRWNLVYSLSFSFRHTHTGSSYWTLVTCRPISSPFPCNSVTISGRYF